MSQSFDPFFNSISIPRASTSRSTTRLGAQFVNSFPRQLPQASSVPLPHFNPFRNSRFPTSRPLPSSNSLTSSEPLPDFDLFGNSLPLFRPLPVGPSSFTILLVSQTQTITNEKVILSACRVETMRMTYKLHKVKTFFLMRAIH